MRSYLYVGLGSGIGGVARYATVALSLAIFGTAFPVGTVVVNVLGSALIGVIAALAREESRFDVSPAARSLLAVGFCGGFTTYSFFGWHTIMLSAGEVHFAALYVVVTTVLSLLAVWVSYRLTVRHFTR